MELFAYGTPLPTGSYAISVLVCGFMTLCLRVYILMYVVLLYMYFYAEVLLNWLSDYTNQNLSWSDPW